MIKKLAQQNINISGPSQDQPSKQLPQTFDLSVDLIEDDKIQQWAGWKAQADNRASVKDQLLLKNFRRQARGSLLVDSFIPAKDTKKGGEEQQSQEKRKKKVKINFESEQDDSEDELPKNDRRIFEGTIKNNEWLKMFRQKNQMHDGNREKAVSLVKNIHFDYFTYRHNKYFNKKPVEDPTVQYVDDDMIKLGQQVIPETKKNLPAKSPLKMRLKSLEFNHPNSQRQPSGLFESDSISKQPQIYESNIFSSSSQNQNTSTTMTQRTTRNTTSLHLPPASNRTQRKPQLSQLSQQIQEIPYVKLKQVLTSKLLEFNRLKKMKKFEAFDSNEVMSLYKKYKNQDKTDEVKEEYKFIDDNVHLLQLKLKENGFIDNYKNKLSLESVSAFPPKVRQSSQDPSTDKRVEKMLQSYIKEFIRTSFKVQDKVHIPLSLYDPYKMVENSSSEKQRSSPKTVTSSIISDKIQKDHARAQSQMVNYLMKIEDESEINASSEQKIESSFILTNGRHKKHQSMLNYPNLSRNDLKSIRTEQLSKSINSVGPKQSPQTVTSLTKSRHEQLNRDLTVLKKENELQYLESLKLLKKAARECDKIYESQKEIVENNEEIMGRVLKIQRVSNAPSLITEGAEQQEIDDIKYSLENQHYEEYHSKFDRKVAIWQQNGIREISQPYQIMNFRALHTKNEMAPTVKQLLSKFKR